MSCPGAPGPSGLRRSAFGVGQESLRPQAEESGDLTPGSNVLGGVSGFPWGLSWTSSYTGSRFCGVSLSFALMMVGLRLSPPLMPSERSPKSREGPPPVTSVSSVRVVLLMLKDNPIYEQVGVKTGLALERADPEPAGTQWARVVETQK